MKITKRKCLILLIAMLVPMTSTAFSGCNGKSEVSNATPDQATTPITTQQVTTQVETKPTVAETTQTPTEPDYHEAYKAYKTVLQQNASEIKAYDYQNKSDESKQIVFADIMGDSAPELIFVKSDEDTYNDYTFVTLNIYTYSDGECKKISFKDKDKYQYQLQSSLQHAYDPYILFKSADENDLYLFTQRRWTNNTCRIFKLTTDDCAENEVNFEMIMEQSKSSIPNVDNSGMLYNEEVSYNKCDEYKYSLLDNMGSLLLYSDYLDSDYGDYYSSEKCKAMTYSEAIGFLDKFENSDNPDNPQNEEADFSVIAGKYNARKNGMISSTLKIDSDGTFVCEVGGFQGGEDYYKSVCRGRINNLSKESDFKYSFYVTDTVMDNEPNSIAEKQYINGIKVTVHYIENDFDTGSKITLYLKGTVPSEMDTEDLENHKSWDASNIDKPTDIRMIFFKNGTIYDESNR